MVLIHVLKLCNVTSGGCLGSAGIKKKNGGRRGGEACTNGGGGGEGRVSWGAGGVSVNLACFFAIEWRCARLFRVFCCVWGLALNLVVRCWVSGVVFVDVVLGVEVPHVGSILCRSGCTSWSGILM